MARNRSEPAEFTRPLRRLLLALLCLFLLGIFVLWRIDSPRVERFRAAIIDRFVPSFSWVMSPVTWGYEVVDDYQSYSRLLEQNHQLREELRQMKAWKEAALVLEQQNARLLELNSVRLDPKYTHITGQVLADSGSPFRQSVLINVGARDSIVDGWAVMDGIGLVGRVSGLGERTSRVILLSDSNSRLPVTIRPSGQRALMTGDNTAFPPLDYLEAPGEIVPGDQVLSSGDGGVFPAGLPIGQVVKDVDGRLRVRLAADQERLEFLRVIRSHTLETISDAGALLAPGQMIGPNPVVAPVEGAATPAPAAAAEGGSDG